jgi:hypothetical protein
MRVVYIAHPLNAATDEERERNRANAARWCAWAAMTQRVAPVADWIVLSGVLSEEEGRERGLLIDCDILARCDEVWAVGGRISPGMAIEIEHAKKMLIPVCDLTDMGYEAPR